MLCEEIVVQVDGISRIIKFQLILILGDNLGLKSILGFTESFKGTHFCRICRISPELSLTSSVDDDSLLRNIKNYEEDIKTADMSKTGIKERCAFNNIKNFHVIDNLSVDVMHDILEGVCKYVLQSFIYEFIFGENKYFTLQTLNNRIQSFDYGHENSNKPPIILAHRIKKKMTLKMSASEMMCVTRYFGLIIGDLIPEDNKHWEMYKCLRQILNIVTSPRIIRSDAHTLQTIIAKLNSMYIIFFGNLKPKFHMLVHYTRILLENGPSVHFWCMRFELRHRHLKANSQSSSSTINLLKTVGTKQLLQMCYVIHSLECGSEIDFGCLDDKECISIYSDFSEMARPEEIECFNWINICNTTYKTGNFIITDVESSEIQFGKITKIIKLKDNIYFRLDIFDEFTFEDHYQAYITQPKNKIKYIEQKELPVFAPCLSVRINNDMYIATRYRV